MNFWHAGQSPHQCPAYLFNELGGFAFDIDLAQLKGCTHTHTVIEQEDLAVVIKINPGQIVRNAVFGAIPDFCVFFFGQWRLPIKGNASTQPVQPVQGNGQLFSNRRKR